METEPREVGREARFGTGDAQVRHKRQPKPAANRCAVDGAHHGLCCTKEADRLNVQMTALASLRFLDQHILYIGTVAELGPGAERGALRCEQDGAAAIVPIEGLAGIGNLADEINVKKVVRRPSDLNGGDHVLVEIDADVLERAHIDFSSSRFVFLLLGGRVQEFCPTASELPAPSNRGSPPNIFF